MSWIADLASKAENLLNTLDNSAADALAARQLSTPVDTRSRSHSPRNYDDSMGDGHSSSSLSTSDRPHVVKMFTSDRAIYRDPPTSSLLLGATESKMDGEADRKTNPRIRFEGGDFTEESEAGVVRPRMGELSSVFSTDRKLNDPFAFLTDTNENEVAPNSVTVDYSLDDAAQVAALDMNIGPSDPLRTGETAGTISSGYHTLYTDLPEHHSMDDLVSDKPSIVNSSEQNLLARRLQQDTMTNDIRLENKLLRSEVSSLSQEVSGLLRRNHKATEENKELRGQLETLELQLRDSDSRVRDLQVSLKVKQSDPEADPAVRERLAVSKAEVQGLQDELSSQRINMDTLQFQLDNSQRQMQTAEKRVQLAQQQSNRLTQELTQYKEKASQILGMKEKLIASLRGTDATENALMADSEQRDEDLFRQLQSMHSECDILREEVSRCRIELEHRELMKQELEIQMQTEMQAFRQNLQVVEQRADREKQLREDADTELAQSRARQREMEDTLSHQKSELHSRLVANDKELQRLRRLLAARRSPPSLANSDGDDASNEASLLEASMTRTDPGHVLALESRLRQLTDTLLARQDALDSVLAQNHALKIRLERAQADNESLATSLSTESTGARIRLPYQTAGGYGCARLVMHNSSIPRPVRPIVSLFDETAMRVTNLLRRAPFARLICLFYFLLLHVWLLASSVMFVPSPSGTSGTS